MTAFRFHQRRTRRWWYAGATLMAAALFAVFFVVGAGAVTGSPSGFESGDGNMTLQAASGTDWNCFQGTTGPGGSAFATLASGTPAGCTVTSGATQTWADGGTTGVGTSEFQFKSGTKFDDPCVTINSGNNPPKDEWSNIAEYTEASTATNSDGGHDLFFYGASIRPVTNGNTSGNIYFSQSTTGCHTVGDVLLAFNFLNGGGTPALSALRWVASGTCYVSQDSAPCWGPAQSINQAGLFDGSVNTSTIDATDNGISGTTLAANAFAEFGINLTQALKVGNPTGTLPCFANQTWVSRSSGSSFTSNPEDVEVVSRPTCGSITIIKHTQNGAGTRSGVDQDFSYTSTGGLSTDTSGFTLNDKAGCDPSTTCTTATNTQSYTLVPPGSYNVTEGANPANFTFVSLTCTHAGNGTTAAQDGTILKQADITLGIGGSAVCTYTNRQQLGAIRINKTSSKGTHPVLAGAKFYICTNSSPTTSNCTAPTPVGGTALTEPQTTDSNGTICVANLAFASYYVFESAAPSGYGIDDSSVHTANVNGSGDCSSSTSATVTLPFTDTPLSKIYLGWHSLAGVGVTTATIACGSDTAAAFDDGGSTPAITKTLGNGTSTLAPGTYTCTVVIDP